MYMTINLRYKRRYKKNDNFNTINKCHISGNKWPGFAIQGCITVPELPIPKLICNLSSDQISTFLRALDEAKIVQAKSLNEVFKVIVPFLSTPHRSELSPGSVRSKSYTIEERDRDLVLDALEKVIVKIRKY